MAYMIREWVDDVRSPARTYNVVRNADGTITLQKAGRVIQQGTNLSAANFNNMEQGIFSANAKGAEALRLARTSAEAAEALKGIIIEQTLTSSQRYPFNNSAKTVALSGANQRYTKDYTVTVEAESLDKGAVGDIIVSDKLLNGFKVAYTGSAASVKVKCYVQGGK